MRLPQPLLESPFFLFPSFAEFKKAISSSIPEEEMGRIERLASIGLPPITSRHVLAVMFGISPGLIRSFEMSPLKHYSSFEIPKGKATRRIDAPRVALKIIQKWMAVQLARNFRAPDHVFGFVTGRSHLDAAKIHCGSEWIFSLDITDFFQTTPIDLVANRLEFLGFDNSGAQLIARLCCFRGVLAQGAPSSPVLSNMCFQDLDNLLLRVSRKYGVRFTRYADDLVFSGNGAFPYEIKNEVESLFQKGFWKISDKKTELSVLPNRLKVHGLLVHGETIRLTKGYRNRLRAFKHLLNAEKIKESDIAKVKGHLNYGELVRKKS